MVVHSAMMWLLMRFPEKPDSHVSARTNDPSFGRGSRFLQLRPKHSAGFTLIELLVVISIIGMLSSVVLAALNSVRVKADNAARNAMAGEYIKALETYAADHNGFTVPNLPESGWYCLGTYPSGQCSTYGGVYTFYNNSLLSSALSEYLPELSTMKRAFDNAGNYYDGPVYYYHKLEPGNTKDDVVEWFLQGYPLQCSSGADARYAGSWYEGVTDCVYTLDKVPQ